MRVPSLQDIRRVAEVRFRSVSRSDMDGLRVHDDQSV